MRRLRILRDQPGAEAQPLRTDRDRIAQIQRSNGNRPAPAEGWMQAAVAKGIDQHGDYHG